MSGSFIADTLGGLVRDFLAIIFLKRYSKKEIKYVYP